MRLTGRLNASVFTLASGLVLSACGAAGGPPAAAGPASSPAGAAATLAGVGAAAVTGAVGGSQGAGSQGADAQSPSSAARPSAARSAAAPQRTAMAKKVPAQQAPATHAANWGTGIVPVPAAGRPVSTTHPNHVVGHGTAASCTSQAVVAAVAAGGVITFSCGPKPVTIVMSATAKVRNTSSRVVLDGGGKVTLSGGGARRILYLDTCDPAQTWTTSHCQDQATPHLTVQNMTFANGNSTGQRYEGGGGGAIFDRGGQLTVINSRFTGNRCDPSGPDLGGAAIRALSQYQNRPVYVVSSTFTGGVCSNGGALSSIGVSWTVVDSIMTGNQAIGNGANPAKSGTPGGGSGGAIYNDGDTYTLTVDGSVITGNSAREGGGAIFYVSNDHTGTLRIAHSTLRHNPNVGFQTAGYPGVFFLGRGHPVLIASTDAP